MHWKFKNWQCTLKYKVNILVIIEYIKYNEKQSTYAEI